MTHVMQLSNLSNMNRQKGGGDETNFNIYLFYSSVSGGNGKSVGLP